MSSLFTLDGKNKLSLDGLSEVARGTLTDLADTACHLHISDPSNENYMVIIYFHFLCPVDSSVGRAEDCRCKDVILRSLVQIRLDGLFYKFCDL